MLCHCSSLARACDRPQPCPMSMCGVAAKSDCLICCLSACRCSFMPRDKGGIGRTGKKVRAAKIRRAAAPAQEGLGSSSSSTLGPSAGGASSQWVMPSAGESTASSRISPAFEASVAPKPSTADEQPSIPPLTLRLNAPRPLACPPAALSREDSKRRTRILTEEHNDACECVEMGLPPPEHPNFTEHSPFCQVHVCYAREVGCCDPDFKRQDSGLERAENLPCTCLEGAFEFGWRRGLVPGFEAVGQRERLRRYVHDPTEWPSSNSVDAGHRGRRLLCVSLHCECDSIGRYVPTCPFRLNAATGKCRGDEVANARGYALYHSGNWRRERFGSPSLPSLPVSPASE